MGLMADQILIGIKLNSGQVSEWAVGQICHVSATCRPPSVASEFRSSSLAIGMRAISGCDIHRLIRCDTAGVNPESYADAEERWGKSEAARKNCLRCTQMWLWAEKNTYVALESRRDTRNIYVNWRRVSRTNAHWIDSIRRSANAIVF